MHTLCGTISQCACTRRLRTYCFTRLDQEISLAWHLPRGTVGKGPKTNGIAGLAKGWQGLRRPKGGKQMSCEDYDSEDPMKLGVEEREVLTIVWRILRNRTDWIAQGQMLMEEIVAEIERHTARKGYSTSRRSASGPSEGSFANW